MYYLNLVGNIFEIHCSLKSSLTTKVPFLTSHYSNITSYFILEINFNFSSKLLEPVK